MTRFFVEDLLDYYRSRHEQKGYLCVDEEAELDEAGVSINNWHNETNNIGENIWRKISHLLHHQE
tara:strand:+ start:1004 stop:1198 length:195 start_codon:yes stop_codon:yes gene_type:complete